jgi:hypothetical protein
VPLRSLESSSLEGKCSYESGTNNQMNIVSAVAVPVLSGTTIVLVVDGWVTLGCPDCQSVPQDGENILRSVALLTLCVNTDHRPSSPDHLSLAARSRIWMERKCCPFRSLVGSWATAVRQCLFRSIRV